MPEGEKQYHVPNRKLRRIKSDRMPLLAQHINEISEVIESLPKAKEIKVGKGLLMIDDVNTTTIRMGPQSGKTGQFYPFRVYRHAQDTFGGTYLRVRVYYGTVENRIPTIQMYSEDDQEELWGGALWEGDGAVIGTGVKLNEEVSKSIVAADDPLLTSNSGEPWLRVNPQAGEYTVYLMFTPDDPCGGTSTTFNNPEIRITATPAGAGEQRGDSEGSSTSTRGSIDIARITVTADETTGGKPVITQISQSLTHSLMHKSCGVQHYFWGV